MDFLYVDYYHIWYHVACVAGILAMIEMQVFQKEIDLKKIIYSALVHDIVDSKLTHITYDAQNLNEYFYSAVQRTKQELWNRYIEDVESEEQPRNGDYIWCMDEKTYYLIESADVIDAMCFAKREVERNNKEFVPILERQKAKFQKLKEKYPCVDYFERYVLD